MITGGGVVMRTFMRDSRGSAVRWFAMAAVVLSVASMAGTRMLAWVSQPGRVALVDYHAPDAAPGRQAASASPDVDMTPTGSIPSGALVIRLR